MKSSIGGAVFGKPQIRRSFSSDTTPPGKPQEADGKENHLNTGSSSHSQTGQKTSQRADTKLKLVQLEIAEREACQVLRNLCEEAASMLPNQTGESGCGSAGEVVDLLSGVLQLGSLCKRIGHTKEELERQLQSERRAHDKEMAEKNSLVRARWHTHIHTYIHTRPSPNRHMHTHICAMGLYKYIFICVYVYACA